MSFLTPRGLGQRGRTVMIDIRERLVPKPQEKHRSARAAADRLALDALYEIAKTFASAPDPVAEVPQIFNVLSSFLDLRHGVLALLAEP
ncbi:hypothetical protein C8J30_1191, partial [Rhodobacter viridis]